MRRFVSVLLASLLMASAAMAQTPAAVATPAPAAMKPINHGDQAMAAILDEMTRTSGVPAIGAVLVQRGKSPRIAVAGVRKQDTDVGVTLDDLWHMGSNTKAITATAIGVMVERGQLRWDSTMGEIFPEIPTMNPLWKPVTVEQVLTHRAGLPPNLRWETFAPDKPLMKQRAEAVVAMLTDKPDYLPGSKAVYSNTGYVLAGAIIEKVAGEPYESAIRADVLRPLRMRSVGFGGTGTVGQIDQPWPHLSRNEPAPTNGPTMDNPAIMAPAGTAHMTLADYGLFLEAHLDAGRTKGALLKPETFAYLHSTPFADEHALGWLVAKRKWGGRVLTHAGSNTMNYAVTWLAPDRDLAVAVVLNQGDKQAMNVADETAWKLLQLVMPPDPTPTPEPTATPTAEASPKPVRTPRPKATPRAAAGRPGRTPAPAAATTTAAAETEPTPTATPTATATPAATASPAASATPAATKTPRPKVTPRPAVAPRRTPVAKAATAPSPTPAASPAANSAASPTPVASATPKATATAKAAETPKATATQTPAPTATPRSTVAPKATTTPKATASPIVTATPRVSATPKATPAPKVTATPKATASPTPAPEVTPAATPTAAPTPSVTATPVPAAPIRPLPVETPRRVRVRATATPEPTATPEATPTPEPTPTAKAKAAPKPRPTPRP